MARYRRVGFDLLLAVRVDIGMLLLEEDTNLEKYTTSMYSVGDGTVQRNTIDRIQQMFIEKGHPYEVSYDEQDNFTVRRK
jgi:hypothetical protein